jgi:5-methylcytosine-specific restriction protein A
MREPRKPCGHAGCRTLALVEDRRYCQKHLNEHLAKEKRRQRALNAKRDKTMGKLYSSRWRKARALFLRINPVCVDCGLPANEVDHEIPHRGDPRLFWDRSNWTPRCKRCHSRKTVKRDGGFQR